MRLLRLASFMVLLTALPLLARDVPTITSISPDSLHEMSGEWFMTIEGTHFLPLGGVNIVFTGPAGTIALPPNSGTDTELFVWIPLEVLNAPGNYTVKVRVPNGASTLDSNTVALRIIPSTVRLIFPAYLYVEATSLKGAIAQFEVSAISRYGEDTFVDCNHRSGEEFPFDITRVDCVATDNFGGEARESFEIEVADRTPPSIDVPRDLVAFGEKDGATAKWDAKVFDVVDPEVRVTCLPESGSFFRLGTSTVSCTSVDRFKNQGIVNFRVHAGDEATPALIVPDGVITDAASREGSEVKFETTATDFKGNAVGVECDSKSGSLFPLGVTTVKCTAGSATELFDVKVADLSAPQLFLPREVTERALSLEGAFVSYDASAKDAVEGEASVNCYPASGELFAPGTTRVNCSTSDKSGNEASNSFVVTVLPPIDDTEYARNSQGLEDR